MRPIFKSTLGLLFILISLTSPIYASSLSHERNDAGSNRSNPSRRSSTPHPQEPANVPVSQQPSHYAELSLIRNSDGTISTSTRIEGSSELSTDEILQQVRNNGFFDFNELFQAPTSVLNTGNARDNHRSPRLSPDELDILMHFIAEADRLNVRFSVIDSGAGSSSGGNTRSNATFQLARQDRANFEALRRAYRNGGRQAVIIELLRQRGST